MDTLLSLRDILTQEVDTCCNLVALSEQEKAAIMQNDVQALASIVEKKQSALTMMQTLKGKRNDLTDEMRAQGDTETGRQHLDGIICTAQGALKDELKNLVERLEGQIIKLKSINALNRMLIDTQQKYTSFCINLLTGRDSTPGTYSGSGRMDEVQETNQCLVDQAI